MEPHSKPRVQGEFSPRSRVLITAPHPRDAASLKPFIRLRLLQPKGSFCRGLPHFPFELQLKIPDLAPGPWGRMLWWFSLIGEPHRDGEPWGPGPGERTPFDMVLTPCSRTRRLVEPSDPVFPPGIMRSVFSGGRTRNAFDVC